MADDSKNLPANGGNKPPVKADPYDGIPKPARSGDLGDLSSKTVSGGAFWVNNVLVNADGERLSDEKVAEFRKHHERLAEARSKS